MRQAHEPAWRHLLVSSASNASRSAARQSSYTAHHETPEWKLLALPLAPLIASVRNLSLPPSELASIVEVLWTLVVRAYTGSEEITYGRINAREHHSTYTTINLGSLGDPQASTDLASLIAARTNSTSDRFLSAEDNASYNGGSAIWLRSKSKDVADSSLGQHCEFDIVIEIQLGEVETSSSTAGLWYRHGRASDGAAHRIANTFIHLLSSVESEYHTNVAEINLFSPEDSDLLQKWNSTLDKPPRSRTSLHNILQTAIERDAEAPAVEAWDGLWSYRELGQASSAIASYLQESGVGNGTTVLLLREKSRWTVAAMVAILICGAACVPLDIRLPRERLNHILAATQSGFVMTDTHTSRQHSAWMQEIASRNVQILEPPASLSHAKPCQFDQVSPNAAAFIFFTSGSTGTPKGVVQEHHAVAGTVLEMAAAMKMDAQTRTFQYASHGFDPSIGDAFATFSAGGVLCVPSESQRLGELSQTIEHMRATHICITPTTLARLDPSELPSLRRVVVGGESLTPEQARAWHPRISTIYGTTESVIWDTYHDILMSEELPNNIGRGMGTTTWIVDQNGGGTLSPIGAIGELLIGGPYLSRGYLHDQRRTQEAFVHSPTWSGTFLPKGHDGYFYRTGDLACYNDDGTIQYLGRKDQQVKLHGQRIELADVEHALRKYLPDDTSSVVEVIQPRIRQGQKLLAAFLDVPTSCSSLSVADVRQQLNASLPTYMVPSHFIRLDLGIPTTSTGKVDRIRLRALGQDLTETQILRDVREPKKLQKVLTSQEQRIRDFCCETLQMPNVDAVPLDMDFFQLGGTSIHAIQLVALARQRGFTLAISDIFGSDDLASLAKTLKPVAQSMSKGGKQEHSVPAFASMSSNLSREHMHEVAAASCGVDPSILQDVFPCSALQEGMLASSFKNADDYVQQAILEFPASISMDDFRQAYERAVEDIDILRCRAFSFSLDGYRTCMAVIDERPQWTISSNLEHCCNEDRALASNQTSGGRLVRTSLVTDHAKRRYFVWTLHHALFDGWSLSLMVDEIESQLTEGGRTSTLVPFRNFIHHLHTAIDHDSSRAFWRTHLEGASRLEFPYALPAAYRPSKEFAKVNYTADDIRWPDSSITPSTIVRTAWAILLSQYSASSDVTFGETAIGRYVALTGIEHVAGPTITTIPRRIRLDPKQTLETTLRSVQKEFIQIVPFEQLGLSEIASLSESAQTACSFQTLLVIQPGGEVADNDKVRIFDRQPLKIMGSVYTYAITLQCWLLDSGAVELRADYDTTVLSDMQMQRILRQLSAIICQICASDPADMPLNRINLNMNAELAQLSSWNKPLHRPPVQTILELFAHQAMAYPSQPAVDAWDGAFTYDELDRFSTSLASTCLDRLRQLNRPHSQAMANGSEIARAVDVRPTIAVCAEKSRSVIATFLAVLKAGAVCLLIDPALPDERIRNMLEISRACVALTSREQIQRLGKWISTTQIPNETGLSPSCTLSKPLLEHDACIVFTSGSTGVPKAICWSHLTIASVATSLSVELGLTDHDRLFQFSSYAFDVSIHESLAALVSGACICVPSELGRQDKLEQSIALSEASTIILTPSVAQVLTAQHLPSLRTIVFAGEPLKEDIARRWASSMIAFDWYGPAEHSLVFLRRIDQSWQAGNLGTGICTNTWIVNSLDVEQLQPIGAIGELLVQGSGMATRYAGDEIRTRQSFIEPPSWWFAFQSNVPKATLYRTGDLARYADDGSVILCGRRDAQVKIRGQRVELGEIETKIEQLLGIEPSTVVVDLVDDMQSHGRSLLVAFVRSESVETARPEEHLASGDWTLRVQGQLGEFLPSFMVPAFFIKTMPLPTTTTNKVDRRKLRDLGRSWIGQVHLSGPPASKDVSARPSSFSEAELVLRALWAEILGVSVQQITPSSNFFRLGGNSIDAMRLVAAAGRAKRMLSVKDILLTPTLSKLALVMSETSSEHANVSAGVPAFSMLPLSVRSCAKQTAAAQCQIAPDLIEDIFPCTPLQSAMLAQTYRCSEDYVSRTKYKIHGNLALFKSSWATVVAATPILRTRVVDVGYDDLCQVQIKQPLEWTELQGSYEDFLRLDQHKAMALGNDLVRWAIINVTSDPTSSFTFVLTIHHSLFDGWSLDATLRSVESIYNGEPMTRSVAFQPFVKYAVDPGRKSLAEDYWQRKLDGAATPHFPDMAAHHRKPRATNSFTYDGPSDYLLHPSLTEFTWTTLLRAAWGLVIARYSGCNDVIFGVTVSGRQAPIPDVERIGGPTIASVVFRVICSSTETIQSLLGTVHHDAVEMTPFEQIGLQNIRRLGSYCKEASDIRTLLVIQPPREPTTSPYKLFGHQEACDGSGVFSSTALVMRCSLGHNAPNQLPGFSDIGLHLDFDPTIIDAKQAQHILQQMNHTVRVLSSTLSSTKIGDLDFLSDFDKKELLRWTAKPPEPANTTVVRLFQELARKTPDAPAIDAWDAKMSYLELDRYSTSLARRLGTLGLQQHQHVPLYFEKSAWTIVAVFGIFKAGGTAVLLEPAQPADRLRLILKLTQASLMLSSMTMHAKATELFPDVPVMAIDLAVLNTEHSETSLVAAQIDSKSPAYIVFTSGSTGTPKGVVITHGNICTALKHRRHTLPYSPSDRILDSVSYAFDVAWGNIIFTLCSGACLCIPKSLHDFAACINEFRVTIAGVVPSVARLLDFQRLPTLRKMTLGGETYHPADMRDAMQHVDIFNSYAPAECAVSCCVGLQREHDRAHVGVSMGATTWIVDETYNGSAPSSIGSIGELWLEGPQVGMGYLNDPVSTAAAFFEGNPTWTKALSDTNVPTGLPQRERRFYRTGDLAQYASDGRIHIIGRKDTQVKLRGQRLELEEVEREARKYMPQRTELAAEVIVPEAGEGRQFLVVYVAQNDTQGLDEARIKALQQSVQGNLRRTLPSYMCPSALIHVATLPRLAAGKIDRTQLKRLGSQVTMEIFDNNKTESDQLHSHRRSTLTAREQKLCDLWAKTLNISANVICAEDNFFQLDRGDSISAMRLVGLAQKNNWNLTVADIFSHPTLQELAAHVIEINPSEEEILPFSLAHVDWSHAQLRLEAASLCELNPEQIEDVIPCTALQEALLALSSRDPMLYVSQERYELREGIDENRLKQAWDDVARSAPILRTRIVDLHPHGLHQVIVNETIAWNSSIASRQFGLGTCLTRYRFVGTPESRQMEWQIHHALYDAWSIPRILQSVERSYLGRPQEQYLPIHPFVKYVATIDKGLSRDFWSTYLADAPPANFPPLPARSREFRASSIIRHSISDLKWPRGISVTPTTWIRTAWALLLARLTNSDDITFGTVLSGRQAPLAGIQDVLGPTITTVPIRVRVDWSISLHDFADQLQRDATKMIAYEQIGLRELRKISEAAKSACEFRTLLNVQAGDRVSPDSSLWSRQESASHGRFDDFPLIVDCELHGAEAQLELAYDPEIMTSTQAERVLMQMEAFILHLGQQSLDLEASLAVCSPMSSLDLATLSKWNQNVPVRSHVCLDKLIQKHFCDRPDALAVQAWDGRMSYRRLDQLSTGLASYLHNEHECKVGPGMIIACCFEKTVWTVVAAMAIMKTGAAFTLMDASQPEQRLRTIVSQVNGGLVLSSAANIGLAKRLADRVVVVDSRSCESLPASRPHQRFATPDDPLYVVFTSGSTGMPKGAIITHSNFSSAVLHQGQFMDYTPQTRVYDFASYSFDIAISNLLHSLASGGCLCIPSEADRRSNRLAESMESMGVNTIDLTPSVTRTLEPKDVPSLRTLILGGEAALRSDINRWAPYVRVLNGIGQAECTVTTTMAEMLPTPDGVPDLGKAMGTVTWIVDPANHDQLAMVGAVGELLVEGPLVGAGYLNDPDKTQASFIEDPAWLIRPLTKESSGRSGRLYKTGDLVRYDTDGALLFIGRKDAQIKIRGQRIELEEVEYHVHSLFTSWDMQVSVAAETLQLSQSATRGAVLIVFISASEKGLGDEKRRPQLQLSDLKNSPEGWWQSAEKQLSQDLPSAMVPFAIIPLNYIPFSPTGKTDRKRLKAFGMTLTVEDLAHLRGVANQIKRMPTNPREKEIREIWAEVLVVPAESIGVDDAFVQLGGDSISAMRLVSIMRRRGYQLDLGSLLAPKATLASLAVLSMSSAPLAMPDASIPFELLGIDNAQDFVMSHILPHTDCSATDIIDAFPTTSYQDQCIKAAVTQSPPGYINYFFVDISLTSVSEAVLKAACRSTALHLPILRTVFVPYGKAILQVITKASLPGFSVFDCTDGDQLSATSEEVAKRDWQTMEFRPGQPSSKFMLVRVTHEPRRARLIIRLSHASYDGISLEPILQTLLAAIEQQDLPRIGSFAAYVQHTLSVKSIAVQYWAKLLSEASMTSMPDDTSRDVSEYQDRPYTIVKVIAWPKTLPHSVTAATFSTACWATVLARLTRQTDVVFGRLVSGRAGAPDSNEGAAIVGPCLNVVPIRVMWPKKILDHNALRPDAVVTAIQQQNIDSIPFESTALSDIVAACPHWAENTDFGSVIQYQNIEEIPCATLHGEPVSMDVIPTEFRPPQLWLLLKPLSKTEVEVCMFGMPQFLAQDKAQILHDQFCKHVSKYL